MFCLRWAQLCKSRLEANGWEVWLARDGTEKRKPPLATGVKLANEKDAVLLCLHLNSAANPTADYCLVRYSGQGVQLAACLLAEFRRVTQMPENSHLDQGTRGQALIRGCRHSAVICEPCFVSHPERAAWLRTPVALIALAGAVCRGLSAYERMIP